MDQEIKELLEQRLRQAVSYLKLPETKFGGAELARAKYIADDMDELMSGRNTTAFIYRKGYEAKAELQEAIGRDDVTDEEIEQKKGEIEYLMRKAKVSEWIRSLDFEDDGSECRHAYVRVTPEEHSDVPSGRTQSGKRNFRSLFGSPQSRSEIRSLDLMMNMIHSGRYVPELEELRSMGANTLVGQDGGYLVPDNLIIELFNDVLEKSVVLSRAEVVSMTGGSRLVSGYDGSDRSTNLYGFTSQWINEGESPTLSKPKFHTWMLKARKLAIFSAATNEMLTDALGGGNAIDMGMRKSLQWAIDKALLFDGEGTSSPQSLFNSNSKITVSKEGSQDDNTILYQNLVNMEARLLPELDSEAVWIANQSCKPQLRQLYVELIADADAELVPALKRENGKWMLLDRELIFTEHCPALGSQGDIMLVHFPSFTVGIQKEISIARSEHFYFSTDETAFRAIVRLDSGPKLATAVTPSNGGATLSWCIDLQARTS
ncbi:MAG: phage major capsid protein [Bdellovibrionales bacterium]|nr:phage major capsid protein [Bdellovibrionales bacterium]